MTSSKQMGSIAALFPEHDDQEEAGRLAIHLAQGAFLPMVLKSAIELHVIDILSAATSDGACLSPSDIASRIPTTNPDAPLLLERMLRLLASHGVLKCSFRTKEDGEVERVYAAGAVCRFLTRNENGEGSLAPLLLLINDDILVKSWYRLNDAILNGGIPFHRAYGMTAYQYAGIDQRFNRVFNQALANHTNLFMKRMLDVYCGFSGIKVLVDVGGGTGIALGLVTAKYSHIKGINYDLPHVVANAPSYSGVEHVGGDMFVSVPKADAVLLKSVLHNWSDEHCLKIMENCFKALPSNGRMIACEWILPDAPEDNVAAHVVLEQDVFMSVQIPGGKERTLKEFEALALKSGFSKLEHVYCAFSMGVMEFHKITSPNTNAY